jgi:hypothetical protein
MVAQETRSPTGMEAVKASLVRFQIVIKTLSRMQATPVIDKELVYILSMP